MLLKNNVSFITKSSRQVFLLFILGSKSSKAEKEFIFDPTLPKILVECPECGGDEACYIVTPDEGETSIEVQLICTNFTRCDKVWVLEPSFAL